MKLPIPIAVSEAIASLEAAGHETWLVGGVRDLLLGRPPHDWDLTTSATPKEIKSVFQDCPMNCMGERFGTIAVRIKDTVLDITSFRREGAYQDHRHPSEVQFTKILFEDLKRRDFTINAIVYHPEKGLRDFFCGKRDLKKRLIRAIGDADARFNQDAVRILRALRFSAVLGFDIEEKTRLAIHRNKELLLSIAPERVIPELKRMLCGRNIRYVLSEFSDVIGILIPEILPTVGFSQHSPFHQYDVWQHTVHAIAAAVPDPTVRLALLFHDISKPGCLTIDATGRGHFYSHPKKSARIAEEVLKRLKFPTKEIETLVLLISLHDSHPSTRADVKLLLSELGSELFPTLIQIMQADTLAHSKWSIKRRMDHVKNIEEIGNSILSSNECFSLKDLAVNGNDLAQKGVKGKRIGELLFLALQKVICEEWENDRDSILYELEKNNW